LAAHRSVAPVRRPAPPRTWQTMGAPRTTRVVYGYYPYWVDAWEHVRWDLLTHIAYFAVELAPNGTFEATHGWPDRDFVDTAHAHGVKAELAFTLFDGDGIAALVATSASRARAITAMVDAMEAGGADGINVDFEGVPGEARDGFSAFMEELRAELERRGHVDATLSIAGPAVDWTASFDLARLLAVTDLYFIMGYGYHWGGSGVPGPVGQLRVGPIWRDLVSISMERTLAYYSGLVPAAQRPQIVFGVPYYGYEWPATSSAFGARTTGGGRSRTYAVARRAVEAGRVRQWEPESENAWFTFEDGGWKQTWYDDEESLAAKYQLALEQEIGGVGIWALGYDEDYPELWDVLDAHFTAEPAPKEGTRAKPIELASFPFTDARDTTDAPSHYFNHYACAPDLDEYGREWVYAIDLCQSGRLDAVLTDAMEADVDLHLLDRPEQEACLARDDDAISIELGPGRYWLVADTYVSDYVPLPGAYTLDVRFTADDPAAGCASGEVCVAGTCVRTTGMIGPVRAEPAARQPEVTGTVRDDVDDPSAESSEASGCTATHGPGAPVSSLLGLVALALLVRTRRRART
ncbi:glycosyl hydrolase family 18 protein, partial [Myxococcota bacterium]|nr:glycosyl hydrolase family 18 protein [Myxococcota bacterium]